MAQLPQVANTPENSEGMDDFSAIDPGKYPAIITKSEFKPTKNKDGHYLQLQFKIIDGKYKGRVLFDRLNLDNKNPTTVQIANKALNSICQACDKVGVQDSEELHGIPMLLTVIKKAATTNNPESNDIKYYTKHDGSVPIETTPATNTGTGSGTAGEKKKLPWEK